MLDDNIILQADATAIAGILILLTVAYYFEPRSEKEVVGKNAIWTVMKISRLVIAVVTPFAVSAILVTLENVFDGSWPVTLSGLGKYTITLLILGKYAMMVGFSDLIIGLIWLLRRKATKSWVYSQKGI